MSKTVTISSTSQFDKLLKDSRIVVTDFYADWCGPCKQIAPIYEQLSAQLTRPSKITFSKVNTDQQKEVASRYGVTALPTFIVFKNSTAVSTIKGANPRALRDAVQKLSAEAESDGSGQGGFGEASGSGSSWLGASLPRNYDNITEEVDVLNLDLLNASSDFGNARTLFDSSKPSALDSKGKGAAQEGKKDWVESDTDEQLMLFVPFRATLKVHTLQITSISPESAENEVPMRPKTLKIYSNRPNNLGFEEAEDTAETQTIELGEDAWDTETGTANVELRFVKFQNTTSLVIFVVDGEGDGEKVRIDRIRVVGESGAKREMGKLQKAGEEPAG